VHQLLDWFYVNGMIISTKKAIANLSHTWQNEGVLKPQIIFQVMDMKYKYETNFWVYI
jgi:hypothetical protein